MPITIDNPELVALLEQIAEDDGVTVQQALAEVAYHIVRENMNPEDETLFDYEAALDSLASELDEALHNVQELDEGRALLKDSHQGLKLVTTSEISSLVERITAEVEALETFEEQKKAAFMTQFE